MRKTLLSLMALGSLALGSSGCTITPEGTSFIRGTIIGAGQSGVNSYASEKGRVAANPALGMPPQTNVNVYNQGQGWVESQKSEYFIDKDLLDGTEKDEKEAKAVYRVLVTENSYIGAYMYEKYFKKVEAIDLEGCPENFKTIFKEYAKNEKVRWRAVVEEALKEGVRKR